MIKIHAFIEKKEEGGKERPPNLVANDRFQAWWPLKVSKLGCQWNVPSLAALERFQAWLPMECSMFIGLWKEMGLRFTFLPLSTPKFFT
jgi:hypothetical protein